MSSHILQQMSVDSIVPSDKARHIDQKSEDFKNLANSINAGGVKIPIHVWPHPKRKDKYEILAGVRRWRACKSLKLEKIPAVVHRGISIQVAMTLRYIENKFRKDLEPLEEVAEIARCMDHLNSDAKLIADLLGQTEQWVRLRANIHNSLAQGWRHDFPRLSFFESWSIGHLTLIARLPANSQNELLSEIKKYYWTWKNVSVQDLDRRIGGSLKMLIKAKWNLDDDTLLPKAGSCSDCTKRSGAQPVLWFGVTGDQIKSKDRCLEPQCWNNKMKLYLQKRAKQLSEKHSNLAYIATEHLSGNEKEELSKSFGRVLDPNDVQKSTKSARGSIPALVLHGKGTGTVVFVREKKFARPAGAKRAGAGKPTPLKQRREMLKAKRWAQVLLVMREKVDAAGVDQVTYKDKETGIMAIAALYGNYACWDLELPSIQRLQRSSDKAMQKQIEEAVKKAEREKALICLWNSIKPTLKNLLYYSGPASQTSGSCIDNARWVAKLIQVDIDNLFVQISKQKGFTEPKSWKFLNADGTSKAAKKTGKKKSA